MKQPKELPPALARAHRAIVEHLDGQPQMGKTVREIVTDAQPAIVALSLLDGTLTASVDTLSLERSKAE
jgi:hypothetical protein